MGELANVLEFPQPEGSAGSASTWEAPFGVEPARLIPGSHAGSQRKKKSPSAHWNGGQRQLFSELSWKGALSQLLPESLSLLHPSKLGTAILDVFVISLVFWVALRPAQNAGYSFSASSIGFYLVMFLVFALQSGLYQRRHATLAADRFRVIKAILWTTLLAYLALKSTSGNATLLALALASGISIGFLIAARWFCNSLCGSRESRHRYNVLVVGDSWHGKKIADAIRNDVHSRRYLSSFLPQDDFRGRCGPAMLRRIAREECIDEVIVATGDVEIAEGVILTAIRNQLDIRVVPGFDGAQPVDIESIGGLPLLKIHEHRLPEWQLALKRMADVVLASVGLLVTSPLLLLIAAIIKLDSPGPALYRAERVGLKGHRFVCHKFRTMTVQADTQKQSLRRRNQRQGAFFKILNDPRITRVGGLLRRYSLDELPQLWNVLQGDMSLVGPRPHPPDDVQGYSLEHLQRLDFVPGITGLWQVTARQDPSFERCVELDVEYIKRWSPVLDFRILCRTVLAVLQGSGA